MPKQIVPCLNVSNLAVIADVLKTIPEDSADVVVIGTIIGKARGISFRANPQDPTVPSRALVGMFEGIPADTTRDVVQSGRCFIQPGAIHDIIANALQGDAKGPAAAPQKGKSVELAGSDTIEFMVEVGIKRSSSPVGYTYVGSILNDDPAKVDDLSSLRATLPKDRLRVIAGGAAPAKQLAAPQTAAKTPAKKSGKK